MCWFGGKIVYGLLVRWSRWRPQVIPADDDDAKTLFLRNINSLQSLKTIEKKNFSLFRQNWSSRSFMDSIVIEDLVKVDCRFRMFSSDQYDN